MITTADFKKGTRFLHEGEPYAIADVSMQSPTARGATTLVKVKARNLLNGKLVSETFKSGTKFEEPDLHFVSVQFLYNEGTAAVFMNQESYEQFNIDHDTIGAAVKYLNEELALKAMYFNGQPVNVEFPPYVECEVSSVEPGTRGNTATGTVLTNAELTNGISVRVPLNIKAGDRILVNVENDTFHQRA